MLILKIFLSQVSNNFSNNKIDGIIMKTVYIILVSAIIFLACTKVDDSNKGKSNGDESLKKPDHKTYVVLLGTGTPNAEPERSGPAVAVVVNNSVYLVDCGPGIVRRAAAAFKKGIKALEPKKLDKLFITHLHSDHTTGYPDLILTPWVLGREKPLKVFGPKGTARMTSHLLEAYSEDINNRLSGLEPSNKTGYKVNVTEYKEGLVYQDSNVNVYAYRVEHAGWQEAYAFQFVTKDRVITISGDCRPCEGIIAASMGCDLLVHEAYSYIGYLTRKAEWQKYHKNAHTSTDELAELASTVKPKMLVMYHILSWGAKPEVMVNEVRQNYKGKVVCGEDLGVY
jgi:ribonuclease BN (tRNA processing enzyme)